MSKMKFSYVKKKTVITSLSFKHPRSDPVSTALSSQCTMAVLFPGLLTLCLWKDTPKRFPKNKVKASGNYRITVTNTLENSLSTER